MERGGLIGAGFPLPPLYNLMLESTGRLQKCRIYEMTENKTARATVAYLIVRDQAHENAYAKALESLGISWGAALPIPKTDGGTLTTEQAPEGFPMDIPVERPEEFAPGLDPDLLRLVQATAELELAQADSPATSPPKKAGK